MILGFIIGILIAAIVLLIIALINDGMDFDKEFTDQDAKTGKTCLTTYGKINVLVAVTVLGLSMFILAHIPYSKVKDVVMESDPIGISTVTKRIDIKNVFDGISSVDFMNDIKNEDE